MRLQASKHPLERTGLLQVCCCRLPHQEHMPARTCCHAATEQLFKVSKHAITMGSKRFDNAAARAQEAVVQSSYHGIDFWRELFEDHQGSELWQPLAQTCLRELHELCECTQQCATAVKTAAACAPAARSTL